MVYLVYNIALTLILYRLTLYTEPVNYTFFYVYIGIHAL